MELQNVLQLGQKMALLTGLDWTLYLEPAGLGTQVLLEDDEGVQKKFFYKKWMALHVKERRAVLYSPTGYVRSTPSFLEVEVGKEVRSLPLPGPLSKYKE